MHAFFFIIPSILLIGGKGEGERRSEGTYTGFKIDFERQCTLYMYFSVFFPLCMHLIPSIPASSCGCRYRSSPEVVEMGVSGSDAVLLQIQIRGKGSVLAAYVLVLTQNSGYVHGMCLWVKKKPGCIYVCSGKTWACTTLSPPVSWHNDTRVGNHSKPPNRSSHLDVEDDQACHVLPNVSICL